MVDNIPLECRIVLIRQSAFWKFYQSDCFRDVVAVNCLSNCSRDFKASIGFYLVAKETFIIPLSCRIIELNVNQYD